LLILSLVRDEMFRASFVPIATSLQGQASKELSAIQTKAAQEILPAFGISLSRNGQNRLAVDD
jgi:hypothetical protein